MKYDSKIHHRKSIRLKNYDYAQAGMYFVTIVTQNREYLFGEIIDDEMVCNNAGKMIEKMWFKLREQFQNIQLHTCMVMPNHFHAIIQITVGTHRVNSKNKIGNIIGGYKSRVTNEYIQGVKTNHWQRFKGKLWQRNYWEHIIRDENEYQSITQYILDNPKKWATDKLNHDIYEK